MPCWLPLATRNTAFIERLNLSIRQHVAAVGRRVSTLCKLSITHNFCELVGAAHGAGSGE